MGRAEIIGLYRPTYCTPSASLRSAAPPEVEPRRLRRSGRQVGDPYRGGGGITSLYRPTYRTPSASLCSAAPSEREPRALRASGRLRASPTGMAKTRGCVPVNAAHSLSFATLSSSLREGAKGTSCQRVPYRLRWSRGGCAAGGRLRASPTGAVETMRLQQPTKDTPLTRCRQVEGVCKIIPRLSGSQPR